MSDPVNSPDHYTDGGIETIDFIRAKLGAEGFRAYCLGNAMKYISRAGKKDAFEQDVRKAIWYLTAAAGETAEAPAGDAWIPWSGAPYSPVSPDERVWVRFRDLRDGCGVSLSFRWSHRQWHDDIIAWRRA